MGWKSKFIRLAQRWSKPFYRVGDRAQVSFWTNGVHNVCFEGGNIVPEGCVFSDQTLLGYRSTLGTNNFFGGKVTIGKYCQIGRDVAFHPTNHPMNYLTTYINNQLFNGELKGLKSEQSIEIGHDVWIGHGVIVLAGVHVGNGAILAAGSVVTKNVSPYTIVAGNPAKPIRTRFSPRVIEELLQLEWWMKNDLDLELLKPLFFEDLSQKESILPFLDSLKSNK